MTSSADETLVAGSEDDLAGQFAAAWDDGRSLTVEQFLAANSDRECSDDELFELIYVEIVNREEAGEAPSNAEYRRRFPRHAERLGRLFEVHDAVQNADLPGFGTAPVHDDSHPRAARQMGSYEILEEVGRGGMGIVYRARQIESGAVVALKVIRSGSFAGEEEAKRFRAEIQAASKVRHPGLVPIIDSGEAAGMQFLAMEFIEGTDLARLVDGGPLESDEAARLTMKIAEALHAVHQAGIIHRDLKPHNVLLDSEGRPRLTDFGVARLIDQETRLTSTGQIIGTPGFMPPEQVSGKQAAIDERSDVYALGGVLYYLLTARAPFAAKDAVGTLLNTVAMDLIPPRQWNPRIDPRLERICLRCLEKDPQHRYESAMELANALVGYFAGERSRVHRGAVGRRLSGWFGRHALLMVSLAAIVVLVTLLANLSNRYRERLERVDARDRRDRYNLQLNRASELCAAEPDLALKRLGDTRYCPASMRDFTWGYLYAVALENRQSHRIRDPTTVDDNLFLRNSEPAADAGRASAKAAMAAENSPGQIGFSATGRLVAFTDASSLVHVFDTSTKSRVGRIEYTERVLDLLWSTSGERLFVAIAESDDLVRVREWRENDPNNAPTVRNINGSLLGASVGDAHIVVRDRAGTLAFYDLQTSSRTVLASETASEQFTNVAAAPDAAAITVRDAAGVGTTLELLRPQQAKQSIGSIDAASVRAMSLSRDANHLAVATDDGRVMVWDCESSRLLWGRQLRTMPAASLTFSPAGRCLAVPVAGEIVLLDPVNGDTRLRLKTGASAPAGLRFSPDGLQLGALEPDGLRIWRSRFPSE